MELYSPFIRMARAIPISTAFHRWDRLIRPTRMAPAWKAVWFWSERLSMETRQAAGALALGTAQFLPLILTEQGLPIFWSSMQLTEQSPIHRFVRLAIFCTEPQRAAVLITLDRS